MKTIFVFTGGGLAPALNPTLYGVITAARQHGYRVLGGLSGWASLLPGGKYVELDKIDVESIKNIGGTFLRSSRTNPLAFPNGIEEIKKRLKELNVDAVIAVGGDDTLGAAAKLHESEAPIIGIPKTVDNDLPGTYFTPGFPSAAFYISSYAREIREDAAYALSRIFVIETQGMKAGWLAAAGVFGHPDMIVPPEWPVVWDEFIQTLDERYCDNGRFATVLVAQEAKFEPPLEAPLDIQPGEQYGHKRQHFICLSLRDKIKQELGVETKALYPGNYVETGKPIALDRDLAIKLGERAAALAESERYGVAVCISRPDPKQLNLTVTEKPLAELTGAAGNRHLPEDYFDKKNYRPTKLFLDYMEPLLGPYEPRDDEYTRLIKKIASRS